MSEPDLQTWSITQAGKEALAAAYVEQFHELQPWEREVAMQLFAELEAESK